MDAKCPEVWKLQHRCYCEGYSFPRMADRDLELEAQRHHFDVVVTELTASSVFFLFFVVVGGLAVYWFQNRRPTFSRETAEEAEQNTDDFEYIPFILTSLSMAVALSSIFIVPFTIVSTVIMQLNLRDTEWLNSELLLFLWNLIFWSTNVALFLLIPFSFFYNEAEGFSKGPSIVSRVIEASLTVFLVDLCLLGFLYIASSQLKMFNFSIMLPFSAISFGGSLIVLYVAPEGLYFLLRTTWHEMSSLMRRLLKAVSFLRSLLFKSNREERFDLNKYVLEEEALRQRLSRAESRGDSTEDQEVIRHGWQAAKEELEKQVRKQHLMDSQPSFLTILCKCAVVLFFSALLMTSLSVRCLSSEENEKENSSSVSMLFLVAQSFLPESDRIEIDPKFQVILAIVDGCVALYLAALALVGLYRSSPIAALLSSTRIATMREATLHTGIILMFSAALPAVSHNLGLCADNVMQPYRSTGFFLEPIALLPYDLDAKYYHWIFLVAIVTRLFTLIFKTTENKTVEGQKAETT